MLGKPNWILSISPNCLINPIIHEHLCKILYVILFAHVVIQKLCIIKTMLYLDGCSSNMLYQCCFDIVRQLGIELAHQNNV